MTGSGDDRDEPTDPSDEDPDGSPEATDDRSTGTGGGTDRGTDRGDPDAVGPSDSGGTEPPESDPTDPAGSGGTEPVGSSATDPETPADPGASPPSADPDDAPAPKRTAEESHDDPVSWFLRTDHAGVTAIREVLSVVVMVGLVAALLFAVSGIWPPLVAIESGSMEPHMYKGDLVFVVEDGRFAPDEARNGVVTYRQGNPELQGAGGNDALEGYWSFGTHGNVIIYEPNGRDGTPIIHRAHIYVEEGENWYDEADPQYVGNAESCEELSNCPAPHDGFITKGDNNPRYDQVGVSPRSTVVKPEWVRGVAKVRVPWLGCIRLELSGVSCL